MPAHALEIGRKVRGDMPNRRIGALIDDDRRRLRARINAKSLAAPCSQIDTGVSHACDTETNANRREVRTENRHLRMPASLPRAYSGVHLSFSRGISSVAGKGTPMARTRTTKKSASPAVYKTKPFCRNLPRTLRPFRLRWRQIRAAHVRSSIRAPNG